MDATLTRVGNVLEDRLLDRGLGPTEFSDLEDLLVVCRQAASLQPDGTRQPVQRCEVRPGRREGGVGGGRGGAGARSCSACGSTEWRAALRSHNKAPTSALCVAPAQDLASTLQALLEQGEGTRFGLDAETEAFTLRLRQLVQRKLEELLSTLPSSRQSEGGSGGAQQ